MKRIALAIIALSVLIACDPNRVYEDNADIQDAIWEIDVIPQFEFEIDDASAPYNLHINIRNGISYPFHNIYVKYNLKDSSDRVLMTDMTEFFLFDPKTGEPQGDGLGDLFDNRFPLIDNLQFDYTGRYSVEFQQYMRLDSLPMIVSVGLRVERATDVGEN